MSAKAKTLQAGRLRHRISIDRQDNAQDPVSGAITKTWTEIAANVPAAVEPLSGREWIAANQVQSLVSARVTVRYRPDLDISMRVRHGGDTYRLVAILPDANSGREWLTLMAERLK